MLLGYLDPQDEADAFDAEGYFRTGDLAHWTDEDYLTISGRLKDLIIRNGENISPKEIEDALSLHPQISEVAVVGIPDDRTGERACAVVVPWGNSAPDVASLRAYLRGFGLAAFKIPEQVEVWSALPKNDAGKIVKHQVRALLNQPSGKA
jgi:non-ribosomal peptide synthetase component E (peptide arylation enzyme)